MHDIQGNTTKHGKEGGMRLSDPWKRVIKTYREEQERQSYVPRHSPPREQGQEQKQESKRRRVTVKSPDDQESQVQAPASSSVATYAEIAAAFGKPPSKDAPKTPDAREILDLTSSPEVEGQNEVVQEYTDEGQNAVIRIYKDT